MPSAARAPRWRTAGRSPTWPSACGRWRRSWATSARHLRHARDSLSDDPARSTRSGPGASCCASCTRKYGETLAEVRRYGDEAGRRLAELEGYEARAAALQDGIADRARERADAARDLSRARLAAAGGLADAVTPHLRDLAMPAARLEVLVEPVEPSEWGEDGADRVTFLFSANPGEPARPLAKAASGGELSRAMLALRVVLSEAPPTLVFDEIDAGIGGEAGTAVGRLLADLAGRHQVLCVTHLAQVAAFADTHVTVEKAERGSRTVATAAGVEGAGRVAGALPDARGRRRVHPRPGPRIRAARAGGAVSRAVWCPWLGGCCDGRRRTRPRARSSAGRGSAAAPRTW